MLLKEIENDVVFDYKMGLKFIIMKVEMFGNDVMITLDQDSNDHAVLNERCDQLIKALDGLAQFEVQYMVIGQCTKKPIIQIYFVN